MLLSGDLDFEKIFSRVRRGMRDDDLDTLTRLFGKTSLSSDQTYAAESFEPDLQGMNVKNLYRLMLT